MNTDLYNMMFLFWWRDQNAGHKGSYQKCLFDLIRVLKKNDKDQDCLFSAWKNPRHEGNCRKCFAGVLGKITKINTTSSLSVVVIVVSEQRKLPEMLGQGALRKKARIKIVSRFLVGYLSKLRETSFGEVSTLQNPCRFPRPRAPGICFGEHFCSSKTLG